jgi:SOS response regulatory protein OraA/RecX
VPGFDDLEPAGFAAGGLEAERDVPPERSPDPEVRLQHARDVAWRALNRRDHTVAEIARVLARKRVEPAVSDTVVG